jgi:hypothetical protein
MWKTHQQSPNLSEWVERVRSNGTIAFARAYGDFSQPNIASLESDLRVLGIDKIDCPVKQSGQSTVDINIVIDLYEVALDRSDIKTFVLMAGDGDYVRVVAKLRQRMDKDVVVMGVRGTISRDLARAAGREEILEPVEALDVDEGAVIRLIDQFESSRWEGVLPTFGRLSEYLQHPRNAVVIPPQTVMARLNELVTRGVLVQEQVTLEDNRQIRVTRLDRDRPEVVAALGSS